MFVGEAPYRTRVVCISVPTVVVIWPYSSLVVSFMRLLEGRRIELVFFSIMIGIFEHNHSKLPKKIGNSLVVVRSKERCIAEVTVSLSHRG